MTTESSPTTSDVPLKRTPEEGDARSHQGSLRSKLVLSLAAVFFLFLTIDELVRQKVIHPEFVALEEVGAIRDANRVIAAMNSEVEHLITLAHQWASQLREPESETTAAARPNLPHRITPSPKLDWMATVTQGGRWQWLSHDGQSEANPKFSDSRLESLLEMAKASANPTTSGMTRIGNHSLVMFGVLDLAEGESTIPPDHTRYIIVGREIDESMVQAIQRRTQVHFSLQSPRSAKRGQKFVMWEASPSTLVVEVQLTGMQNEYLANIYIEVPRDITGRSNHTTTLARNSFIFGSVVALLLLLLLLQKIVIGPLNAIRNYSDRIAEQGLATDPLVLTGNDEIGELAGAFDKMVLHLSDTQTRLTKASQAAGRSQVASTVIHNVGNVLTNVNSLIDAACDCTNGLRISPLNKLASRLRVSDGEDGLLTATPDYLEGLAVSLESDQQSISQLLSTLNDNVRHIHDVIRAQRHHTDQSIKGSAVQLHDVIEEAIACCRARLDQDAVEVCVTGRTNVRIQSDRSLLLQTVINIIGNARHAMRDTDQLPRQLCIDVKPLRNSVQIAFRDSGCGMSSETMEKVFDAHFTTRESGTGLGLHFCAITLKRLGGSLRVSSEGLSKGSTFTIELPRGRSASNGSLRVATGAP